MVISLLPVALLRGLMIGCLFLQAVQAWVPTLRVSSVCSSYSPVVLEEVGEKQTKARKGGFLPLQSVLTLCA